MPDLRLVQFTDPHLYGDPAGKLRGVCTLPALRAAVSHATRRHAPWDALLITGDLVQDDATGYARFVEVFGDSPVPVYCIPGNHDDPAPMTAALARAPFQVGGEVLAGHWLIVLLDTYLQGSANGRLSETTLATLERSLSEHPGRHALICLHHHPVDMGSRWLDQVGLENGAELLAVLDRHPQVRAVLWGHVHQELDTWRGQVRLLATPSTCAQFKPHADGFAIDARPPGYRWLHLRDDGTLHTGVEWVDEVPA
jgi:3',5'-cyclic-AMP phosphodiesterase